MLRGRLCLEELSLLLLPSNCQTTYSSRRLDPILAVVIFIAGLVFGSFLNVCISRIPRGLSIIAPRSRCPHCEHPIAARDNVPLLSWLWLKGRCRNCGGSISLRYPAVELLTAILFVASYASFGLGWIALKAGILCFLVTGLIFMDAETGLLPAEFTYPGTAVGLLLAWHFPFDSSGTEFLMWEFGVRATPSSNLLSLLDAVVAAALGAGFFFVAWAVYYLLRRRDGLGFGDIAMMAMVGTFLGLKLTVLVIFFAPVMGTIYGLSLLVRRPAKTAPSESVAFLSRMVPFGVFLGTSALISLFMGEAIWNWYLGWFR
jgi:leader peptidase (prepilin peptidase) / N-methyltransferase